MKRRSCLHCASNPWLLSVPAPDSRGSTEEGTPRPSIGLPGTVRWGSWCCESGRRQSENGYFTTPGSHPTTGSAPGTGPHHTRTSAIGHRWGTTKPPRTTAGDFLVHCAYAVQTPPQTQRPRGCFCPNTDSSTFKGKSSSWQHLSPRWSRVPLRVRVPLPAISTCPHAG